MIGPPWRSDTSLLNGHYTFQSNRNLIDLDALVTGLELE
ncbi:hypothetical protein JOE11_004955 [Robbsia andropogonis]